LQPLCKASELSDFADEEDCTLDDDSVFLLLEDVALEEEFFVEELDFAVLLLDFKLSFLLLLDFAELPLLLLEFFTELLDTSSSGSALLPLSSPHAARRNADTTHIAKNFFIQSSPRNKLKHLV
jgi:hypothetical protein